MRVFRTHKLGSPLAPEQGIRYDGLYDIIEQKFLNTAVSHMIFDLRRQPGQPPIRHRGLGDDVAKPSQAELSALIRLRSFAMRIAGTQQGDASLNGIAFRKTATTLQNGFSVNSSCSLCFIGLSGREMRYDSYLSTSSNCTQRQVIQRKKTQYILLRMASLDG